jgi:hypothetical protein
MSFGDFNDYKKKGADICFAVVERGFKNLILEVSLEI